MDRLKSWMLQGSTLVRHIDRSQKLVQALDKEIYQLEREREDRRKSLSGITDGSTPKNPEELPVSNDQDRKKLLSGNAEGSIFKNPEELPVNNHVSSFCCETEITEMLQVRSDIRKALTEALVLTAKHEFVEAARCEEYMRKAYGEVGAKLLQHIIIALENGTGRS
ncbi:hypothetical protein AbraIFM66950_010391, partial [Aspergillus brasiliensis]